MTAIAPSFSARTCLHRVALILFLQIKQQFIYFQF